MFNNIKISNDGGATTIDVPVVYGPAKIYSKKADHDDRWRKKVPIIAYELVGNPVFQPDRNTNSRHKLSNNVPAPIGTTTENQYQSNRVPFDLEFTLYIKTKNQGDMNQIIEQILPFFSPSITVNIKDQEDITVEQDIRITLNNSSERDNNYNGDFEETNEINAELNFTLDGYLYKPTENKKIIRTITLNGNIDGFEYEMASITE